MLYHQSQGRSPRKVLIPDSAHGTNPASCALNGFEAVPFASGPQGIVDPETLARALEAAGGDVAGLMMTNPNTIGLYESAMPKLAQLVHEKGGQVYGDGANMNAVLGRARPGDAGVDVMQYNLHKTFTTPHGGGGPGSGPVAFKRHWIPFSRRRWCAVKVACSSSITIGRDRRPRALVPGQLRDDGARLHLHSRARCRRAYTA